MPTLGILINNVPYMAKYIDIEKKSLTFKLVFQNLNLRSIIEISR